MRRRRGGSVFFFPTIFSVPKVKKSLSEVATARRRLLGKEVVEKRYVPIEVGRKRMRKFRGKKRAVIRFKTPFSGVIALGENVVRYVKNQKYFYIPEKYSRKKVRAFQGFTSAFQHLFNNISILKTKANLVFLPFKRGIPKKVSKERKEILLKRYKKARQRIRVTDIEKRKRIIEKIKPDAFAPIIMSGYDEEQVFESLRNNPSLLELVSFSYALSEDDIEELEFDVEGYNIYVIGNFSVKIIKVNKFADASVYEGRMYNHTFDFRVYERTLNSGKIKNLIFTDFNAHSEDFLVKGLVGVLALSPEDAEQLIEKAKEVGARVLQQMPGASSLYIEVHLLEEAILTHEMPKPQKEEEEPQTKVIEEKPLTEEELKRSGAKDVPEEVREIWRQAEEGELGEM